MRTETYTRSQRFVRISDASSDGTPARKHGIARVTGRALMLWAASSTVRRFRISSAWMFPVLSAAKARSPYLRDVRPDPLCTGADLYRAANERISCRVGIVRR